MQQLQNKQKTEEYPVRSEKEHKKASNVFSEKSAFFLLESAEPFPVNFDDAWQWIGYSSKQKAKSKLTNNFEEDVDFLTKWVKTSTGGRPSESIWLTVDCFKSLGMMAGTKKGKEIRRYFLNCEAELKRRLKEDQAQKHWKVIKACVLPRSVAITAYPDARYRSASANSIAFTFIGEKGVQLFLRGITFCPRLRPVAVGIEVAVTYLD